MSFKGTPLSNFWPAPVTLDGVEYPTVEHAFQAAKTMDPEAREKVRAAKTPALAKWLGRKVPLRERWPALRLEVMRNLIEQKFAAGSELAAALLATGDEVLIEDNTWNDRFWGVCRGKGENHLGKLLMERRAQLRKGDT